MIGEDAARRAIQVHRLANRAKHGGRAVQLALPDPLAADAASAGGIGVPLQSQELEWDIRHVLEQMHKFHDVTQLKLSQEMMSISAAVVQLREDMSQEIQKLSREFTHGYKQAQTVATEPLEFATTEPLYVVATEPLKDGISVSLAGEWREQQNGTVEQQGVAGERQHATEEQQDAVGELQSAASDTAEQQGAAGEQQYATEGRQGGELELQGAADGLRNDTVEQNGTVEQQGAAEERQHATEEQRSRIVEQQGAAEEQQYAAEERQDGGLELQGAADELRSDAVEQQGAVGVQRCAAGERSAEERSAESRRPSVSSRGGARTAGQDWFYIDAGTRCDRGAGDSAEDTAGGFECPRSRRRRGRSSYSSSPGQ